MIATPLKRMLCVGATALSTSSLYAACILAPLDTILPAGESVELRASCAEGEALDLFESVDWRKDGLSVVGGFRPIVASSPTTSRIYSYHLPRNLPVGRHSYQMVGKLSQAETLVGNAQVTVIGTSSSTGPNLVVYLSNPQGGSVSVTGAISSQCNATGRCDYQPPTNSTVTLSAANNSGYDFAGWSGACSGTGSCVLAMVSDKTVTASFNATGTMLEGTPGCGTAHLQANVEQEPTGLAACSVGVPYMMWTSDTRYTWTCPGTGSGSYYCMATRSKGTAGDCGTTALEKGNTTINTVVPSSNLCAASAVSPVVTIGSDVNAKYTWTCTGANTPPTDANCTAKHGYVVQATATGGSVSIASKAVEHGTTTTFTYTPTTGYTGSISGCGGTTLNGVNSQRTYTTGAISTNCTVTGTFSSVQNPTVDPGYGSNQLWIPPAFVANPLSASMLVVADHSGAPTHDTWSYLPGCLNGASGGVSSGCTVSSSYTGIPAGLTQEYTFEFGTTKTLSLRYKPQANAGTSVHNIQLKTNDGSSNLPFNVEMWITTDPTISYAAADPLCKISASNTPYIETGPGKCPLSELQSIYYVNIRQTTAGASTRYFLYTGQDDFQ